MGRLVGVWAGGLGEGRTKTRGNTCWRYSSPGACGVGCRECSHVHTESTRPSAPGVGSTETY